MENSKLTEKPTIFHCLRCGHYWASRQPRPTICAKCKTPYWDKPRKNSVKVQ